MKQSLKFTLVLLALLATAFGSFASVIETGEASKLAYDFFAKKSRAYNTLSQPQLTYIAKEGDVPSFYVFSFNPTGFVIVSAEEGMRPVLGYSLTDDFARQEQPDALRWWLSEYSKQAKQAAEGNVQTAGLSGGLRSFSQSIRPLIQTEWGQDMEYQTYTPMVDGKHCLVGCLAVSMAQMMAYYGYPANGSGKVEYTSKLYECKESFNTDLSQYSFNWNAIRSDKIAAARLLSCCGLSIEMQYGLEASASYSSNLLRAMVNNFRYDKSAKLIKREYYTDEEWEQLLHDELSAGRPVVYGGNDDGTGSHSFICDGYDAEDDFYHINWGWSGYQNGYFAITGAYALNVGTRTYNKHHEMILGLKPDEGGLPVSEIVSDGGNLSITRKSSIWFDTYEISFDYDDNTLGVNGKSNIFNRNTNDADIIYTLKFVNNCSGETIYAGTIGYPNTYSMPGAYSEYVYRRNELTLLRVPDLNLEEGIYKVTLVYVDSYNYKGEKTTWREVRVPVGKSLNGFYFNNGVDVPSSGESVSLTVGSTADLSSFLSDSDLQCYGLVWVAADSSVASVSSDGHITAHSAGETILTGTLPTQEAFSIKVSVEGETTAVESVKRDASSLYELYGDAFKLLNYDAHYTICDAIGRVFYNGRGGVSLSLFNSGVYLIRIDVDGSVINEKVLFSEK